MITLYHNNRCSKSREALALLEQSGKAFTVRYYLEQPLSVAELTALLKALQLPARDLLRSKEDEYKNLGLADPALSEQQLISALVQHPKLMERPVLQVGDNAVIARPADKMLALLA
ncbi:arsenate reductase (glutaredoxin) [Rheinheimera tangshanensis]|jgi:arsenate reductase|uniref:Arsenate reductase n=1 Tax=Rheinheimera tangshanensis TaxID=400153 RepID=A0A5C8LVT3_9GAMM|nr:arsenate reductase (glutaredoxin) [Rheinheimera tangshanensis]TXK79748.1 arsenate reductase (glutaredoxin) [Rheinheimera tangshanensis]GGM67353.1 arsenate reductase [Rheinheimera tangshanensis]